MKVGAVALLLLAILLGDYNLQIVGAGKKVAFTATMTASSEYSHSNAMFLQFKNALTNINKNFDTRTGVFTCKKPGTYMFMFSVCKGSSIDKLRVSIYKFDFGWVTGGLTTADGVTNQVSGSAMVILEKNEKVALTYEGKAHTSAECKSSFSGFLVYPK